VLTIAASALFLICVDMTVLFVALPSLTRDLGASPTERLWILNAYSIMVAGFLPGMGTLGDRFGHRRLFMIGLAIFGLASLAAALASTPLALIAARAGLGIGSATMMPATLTIIRDAFDDTHERAVAIGLWAGIASAGMAMGPLIAGLLLQRYQWGSVFLINLPVVAVALVVTALFVPRHAPPGGASWDLLGSLQLLVVLSSFTWAIESVTHRPWSVATTLAGATICAVFVVAYLRRQRQRPVPLIDLALFRLPGFTAAFLAATLSTAGAVGAELTLSQYLQLAADRTPLAAALVMIPVALGGLISGPLAGRMLRHIAPSRVAAGGFVFSAVCIAMLALNPVIADAAAWLQRALLFGMGLGIGCTVTFASTTIMNAAPPERGGMAAAIEEVGFELGGTLGVAVFGTLLTLAYMLALGEHSADWATLNTHEKTAFSAATATVLFAISALWLVAAVGMRFRR
jgi:MFS transporter, DHA2 family, multidrug resistance protein